MDKLKTLEQYIAERRAISQARIKGVENNQMSAGDWNYVLVKAERDALEHMPRVLDMLEENRRISKIILNDPTVPDHVKFFLNESNKDLEKMVNE